MQRAVERHGDDVVKRHIFERDNLMGDRSPKNRDAPRLDHDPLAAQHRLDAASAADWSQDADQDGYTNVEEYLNGTDPRKKADYTNLGNNVDTVS